MTRRILLAVLVGAILSFAILGYAGQANQIEVTFWHPYGMGSWSGKFLEKKAAEFEAANPEIKITPQSFASYEEIVKRIQQGAAAKNLPSIACIGYGLEQYIIDSGLVTPLNDLLGEDSGTFFDDFFPSLLILTSRDNVVYGVPFALSVAEVFYHSDLFLQAGLDPNQSPRTWEEFLTVARLLHLRLGIYGATFALDDPWIFETAVRSNGGAILSDDRKTCVLDSDIAVKTLQDLAEGTADGSILYNADFFQTLQTFLSKGVAMFATSSYGTLYYHENAPDVRAAPWPAAEGHKIQIPVGGNALFIFGNNTRERQAAARFVQFLTGPEAMVEWAENSGYLPSRRSSLQRMGDFIEGFDNYKIAIDQIQHIVPITEYPGRHSLQINSIIMNALERAMLGKEDAKQVLIEAVAQINKLLE